MSAPILPPRPDYRDEVIAYVPPMPPLNVEQHLHRCERATRRPPRRTKSQPSSNPLDSSAAMPASGVCTRHPRSPLACDATPEAGSSPSERPTERPTLRVPPTVMPELARELDAQCETVRP